MSVERGFCTDKIHVPALKACGLPEKLIYVAGRGGETLEACLTSFRDRPGKLLIAPDLRVFGQSRKVVAGVMARLERARIKVADIIHPQDETVAEMLERATLLIARPRFRDRRTARRRGAKGGLANGEAARSTRAQIDTDTLIRNLVAEHSEIGWPVIVRICGGTVSLSTLRRHYLAPQQTAGRK